MDIKLAVDYVGRRFKYFADKKAVIGDYWFVMPEHNYSMKGDCDDFAITSIWLACDRSIWKFILNVLIFHRYRLYYAKTPTGESHIIGYAQGLWFDNWTLKAVPKHEFFATTGHKKYLFYPSPYIAIFMLLGLLVRNRALGQV